MRQMSELSGKERFAAAQMARADLYFFSRWMFARRKGYQWLRGPHHKIICDALMRVFSGECKRLIINVPPRYSKSELAVINFMAWGLGQAPDAEFIHTSYSGRLAGTNAWQTRELVQSPWYREIFPAVALRQDSQARDEWRTTAGGCVYAVGSGGTITGYGAGKHRPGFGGCFPYGQMVETEVGPLAIGEIVTKRLPVRVWSFNERSGRAELACIDTLWTNPANEILEVALADGSSFRCTPNHRILTSGGWIEARKLPQSLDLVDGKPTLARRFLACLGAVGGDLHRCTRMLRFVVPEGIRKSLRHAGPRFAGLDLADNAHADPVIGCDFGGRLRAAENVDHLSASQFGAGPAFKHRESSVPDGVLHVLGLGTPSEIVGAVVARIAVKMAGLVRLWARAAKGLKDKVRDVAQRHLSADREIDSQVSLAVVAPFERPQRNSSADIAKVGDLIEAGGVRYVAPAFVRNVGHDAVTFCLEVRGNHNFILAQSGAIVSNCIIIDDPHKADEARSDVIREGVIEWFRGTLESRKNSPDTPIILIMQRLHERDLSGWLLNGGNGEEWDHVCLPALREDGSALWPEKHTQDDLLRMQAASPYTFAGQYQQRPAPPEGNIFRPDRLGIIDAIPVGTRFVRAWDLAATTAGPGRDPDWTAGAKIGITPDGRWVIADMARLRGGPEEVEAAMINTAKRDGGSVRIKIPQDPGQAGKAQAAYLIKQLAGFAVSAKPVTGDKITRAEPLAAQINVGNVLMLRATWNDALIDEMRVFPNGTHDDQIDALADGFASLHVNSFGLLDMMAEQARKSQSD